MKPSDIYQLKLLSDLVGASGYDKPVFVYTDIEHADIEHADIKHVGDETTQLGSNHKKHSGPPHYRSRLATWDNGLRFLTQNEANSPAVSGDKIYFVRTVEAVAQLFCLPMNSKLPIYLQV
jgi:hypothetical protein